MGVQGRAGDAGILDVIKRDGVSARLKQRGDTFTNAVEQAISRSERGAVLRIGADKEQGFMKADQHFGVVEAARADLVKQRGDTTAIRAERALRFVQFVEQ